MRMLEENAVRTSAEDIWNMSKNGEFTEDIEAHYKTMLMYLDILNYLGSNTYDEPVVTRHVIASMAYAMPSLAYIDKYRTREISYNLHLVCRNIKSPLLIKKYDKYNSENILLIEEAFSAGLYRLVSGREMYEEDFHTYAKKIYDRIMENGNSEQNVWAIDTISGRYEVFPNAMALMALMLHDRFYGTEYYHVKDDVLHFIKKYLTNSENGLYYEYFQTGVLGYKGETVQQESFWHTTGAKASVNGLSIAFMNYFEPKAMGDIWKLYKQSFKKYLLKLTTEDLYDKAGGSYLTPLAFQSEEICAAMLAAKEMNDNEFFDELQGHFMAISGAELSEGHIYYNALGINQHLICHFVLFARVHCGWKQLFEHSWENYYMLDYNKVR